MTRMSAEEFQREFMGAAKEPSAARVLGGLKARSSGHDFEELLEVTHRVYLSEGVASLEKLPVATAPMPRRWLAKDAQKRAGIARILSRRARFDYYGTLGPNSGRIGRAVAMEAKHSSAQEASLPIVEGTKHSGLALHQIKACAESWDGFGTVACVVWKAGTRRVVFPPQVLADVLKRGERRLYPELGLAYTGRPWNGRMLEDWWPAVLVWLNKWEKRSA